MNSIGHNSAVRGTFADFKTVKTRGVCQLIIEVPIEAADQALTVLGGVPQAKAEQWVGIAPVTAPDAPQKPAETGAPKPSTADWSPTKRHMVQRAALVCKEEAFQQWIAKGFTVMWNHERHREKSPEDRAAYHVRVVCGVESRSHIDPDANSGASFRELMRKYEDSQRGWSEGASR